ncbi:hypothetical protein [Thermomonospora catenispora]|uniref:hypothetical protein n=1 Tax=Thermomonospora catenispora TaxID=2493090 RepID=UPI00111F5CB8|nr:hypothetical protein [Thermomonospora catenispora]TNY37706.1 hypothetical protein EIO00_05925 [Thermomonospora catenispora]
MNRSAPVSPALPLGVQADGTLTPAATALGFVTGTVAVLTLLPLGVLGIILNNMGLERVQTAPDRARTLITWSWVILAASSVLGVALVVAALALQGG